MNSLIKWMIEREETPIQLKSPKVRALQYCKVSVEKIGCTWEQITSKDRKRHISDARKCVTNHLLSHGWTTEATGKAMNRDHSTIVYQKRKFQSLHDYDAEFRHTWHEFSRL